MRLSLIRSSQLVEVRDEAHARALLQEAGVLVADEHEYRQLARRLVDGRMVVVRTAHAVDLDDLDDLHQTAPLLAQLTLAG